MILPRLIRMRDAPAYLGMDREEFNRSVRPYILEIPIGIQGIAFDRVDLDAWAEEHKQRNGRPGAQLKETEQWAEKQLRACTGPMVPKSGTLTKRSADMDAFAKALAKATAKRPSAI